MRERRWRAAAAAREARARDLTAEMTGVVRVSGTGCWTIVT
jgi:hypothetical protein